MFLTVFLYFKNYYTTVLIDLSKIIRLNLQIIDYKRQSAAIHL